MVLPPSGNYISLSNIQSEFGGTNPVFLSEYYTGGGYTEGVTGIPSTGAIFFSQFAGKSKPDLGPITNLVQNASFTSTANWTSSAGWGATDTHSQLFGSSKPSYKTGDSTSTYPSYLMFSYPQQPVQTVTQTISLTSPKEAYTFSFYVRANPNLEKSDKYYAHASFKNASGAEIQKIGVLTLTDIHWQNPWEEKTFTTTVSMMAATSVTITLSGYDVGFWNGNYGPQFTNVTVG